MTLNPPAEFTIVHDNIAPLISALTPASGSFLNNLRPQIRGDFSDNLSGVDVTKVQIQKADHDKAIPTWKKYIQCEETGKFTDCFSVLSRRVLQIWAREYKVTTKEDYDRIKSSEETSLRGLKMLSIKQAGKDILIRTQGKKIGEAQGIVNLEFRLVKENSELNTYRNAQK